MIRTDRRDESPPTDFAMLIAGETAKWATVVKSTGAKAE
jgi:hypothetical protein